MRTTVDLPPAIHERVRRLAHKRSQSLSVTIAELTARGLAQYDEPVEIRIDQQSGFPVMRFGGAEITDDDVAEILDDE